jgi:hypothetical protein
MIGKLQNCRHTTSLAKEMPMKFLVNRASHGSVSKDPPCRGAVRGPESEIWPGEYQWHLELASLEELVRVVEQNGGALGVFAPEEGEEYPVIEILDEDEMDE